MATFFSSAINITPAGTSLTLVDLSSYIPSGTPGVVIRVVNQSTDLIISYLVRKYGSSDNRLNPIYGQQQCFVFIGVSSDRKIVVQDGNPTYLKMYLEGYFDSDECAFFTNGVNKTPSQTGQWVTIDCGSDVPEGAVALIFEHTSNGNYGLGIRKPGSTNNILDGARHVWLVGACDADRKCEFYRGNTSQSIYLIGYITKATMRKSKISLGTRTDWEEIETSGPVPETVVAILELTSPTYRFDVRGVGSTDEFYYKPYHCFAMVEVDEDWLYELKNEANAYEIGWIGVKQTIAFNGCLPNPGDGEQYVGNSVTAYSIPTVRAGDLVLAVVLKNYIDSMPTFYVEESGGLSWQKLCDLEPTNPDTRVWGAVFWARSPGIWYDNAVFSSSDNNPRAMSAVTMAFRPNEQEDNWTIDVSPSVEDYDPPEYPYDVEIGGIETSDNAVAVAGWVSRDDNEWELQTTTWEKVIDPIENDQFRNTWTTMQMSLAAAFKVMLSGGSTGNVVNRQVSQGPDRGVKFIFAIKIGTGEVVEIGATEFNIETGQWDNREEGEIDCEIENLSWDNREERDTYYQIDTLSWENREESELDYEGEITGYSWQHYLDSGYADFTGIIRAKIAESGIPIVVGAKPRPLETTAEINEPVSFYIKCRHSDEADMDTVVVNVNGVDYSKGSPYFSYERIGDGYLIGVNHPIWSYEQDVEVKIDARSMLGEVMEQVVYGFKTAWEKSKTKVGKPGVEIYQPSRYDVEILTIDEQWVMKGIPRYTAQLELWWGRYRELPYIENMEMRVVGGERNSLGKEILENGYLSVKIGDGDFVEVYPETVLNFGPMFTHSKKDFQIRLLVPEGAESEKYVVLRLEFEPQMKFLYGQYCWGVGIYSNAGNTVELVRKKHIYRAYLLEKKPYITYRGEDKQW